MIRVNKKHLKDTFFVSVLLTITLSSSLYASANTDNSLELTDMMKNMEFDPKPDQILLRPYISSKGPIEIRFRDPSHLRAILEATPLIKTKELYFVRDQHAEEGTRMSYLDLTAFVERKSFVHVIASAPLLVTGSLEFPAYDFILPKKSNIKKLTLKTSNTNFSYGEIESYMHGMELASAIENFNIQLFNIRTADARQLLIERAESRICHPSRYPNLMEICSEACILFTNQVEILQKDYIDNLAGSVIYIAPSLQEMLELQKNIPGSNCRISFIDSSLSLKGIYSNSPLKVIKYFEINGSGSIVLTGQFVLKDYGLVINFKDTLWLLAGTISLEHPFITTGGAFVAEVVYSDPVRNKKPNGMPDSMWNKLVLYWKENGITI